MFKCGRFTRRPTDGRAAIFFCLPRLRRRATITPVSQVDFLFSPFSHW